MGRRFVKKVVRKIKRALNPEVIRKEYVDSHNNKHIFIMDVKPHKPSRPTIEGSVEYKDNK